jgi:hypothetical protein
MASLAKRNNKTSLAKPMIKKAHRAKRMGEEKTESSRTFVS